MVWLCERWAWVDTQIYGKSILQHTIIIKIIINIKIKMSVMWIVCHGYAVAHALTTEPLTMTIVCVRVCVAISSCVTSRRVSFQSSKMTLPFCSLMRNSGKKIVDDCSPWIFEQNGSWRQKQMISKSLSKFNTHELWSYMKMCKRIDLFTWNEIKISSGSF